ncbi:Kelch repeat-containing protein [Coraliomargarita sp. W4R53]
MDIGPDSKLYVTQQDGKIYQYTIERASDGNYSSSQRNTINLVQAIPNHNDDGSLNQSIDTRQVTAILAVGDAVHPVLYVTSSDPRIGGGGKASDSNLDTNSSILSRLTWDGNAWTKLDLVRGLPRSEENHSVNGMQYDASNNSLLLCVGGMTNAGSPSNNFSFITEYALAAAIIRVDLSAIDAMPILGTAPNQYVYDLPTLDDPMRAGTVDANDPFGGNDGLNQAMLDPNGPIEIYSPGYRNAYDIVLTESGRVYTWDNGANQGWGGHPEYEGTTESSNGLTSNVTNNYVVGELGSNGPSANDNVVNNLDALHLIGSVDSYISGSYYGGHPNPARANPAGAGLYTHDGNSGTFRIAQTGDPATTLPSNWPPVPLAQANPIEGDFQNPTVDDQALFALESSTNGLTEYTASNFGGILKGDLLTVSYDGSVYRVDLNDSTGGIDTSSGVSVLATGFGVIPLDITTQGDDDIFPGTIWVVNYVSNTVTVFEPVDFFECYGTDVPGIDEDGDGYMNADEIDAGTSPCNAASYPSDADGDFVSDFNDTDDDGDGIPDTSDFFPFDAKNGLSTQVPVEYELLNGEPGFGFFGLGFTGLMHDGVSDYADLIADEINSEVELIAGGAVGLLTINNVTTGDALSALNSQKNGFQFGVNVMATTPAFTVSARTLGPFFVNSPTGDASMGIFIGTGSQDDYIKVIIDANGGTPGMSVVSEVAGIASSTFYATPGVDSASEVFLRLGVDPQSGAVQASYTLGSATPIDLGSPIIASGALLQALQGTPALAVGVIATARNASNEFNATWEEIFITYNDEGCDGIWHQLSVDSGNFDKRHEASYVAVKNKLYLLGGRGSRNLDIYDPQTDSWSTGATPPIEFHHFQAVELNGELWVVGAFVGTYPLETPVNNIYIYNPEDDLWRTGPAIPRPRGAAGVAVYNGQVYIAGGLTNGHTDGHVQWLDRYNPSTDTWTVLADTPRFRDHFQMQIIDDKIWLAGGRRTAVASAAGVFGNMVAPVDYYDIVTNEWTTLPSASDIPTPRGGSMAAAMGKELIIVGGESTAQSAAHDEVEALDTVTHTWRNLPAMNQGRHGSGLAELNGRFYIASGSGNRGGNPELEQQEVYLPCSIFEPELSAEISQLSFQSQPGLSSASQTLTLTNTGEYTLTIGSVATSVSDYQIQTTPVGTLQPGAQTTVSLNFTPTSYTANDINAELYIYSNATNAPILSIQLLGNVEFKAPIITPNSPSDGATYLTAESIHLAATATDFDQLVDLSNGIEWSSDIDGVLGIGQALTLAHLTIGTHTITAIVSDDLGVTQATSLEITIKEHVYAAINAGGDAYTSSNGVVYAADQHFTPTPGLTYSSLHPIAGTEDDPLYQSERWQGSINPNVPAVVTDFAYNIPLVPGDYRLILMFAENYVTEVEKRFIDVNIEGQNALNRFDILFESNGFGVAIDKQYDFTLNDSTLNIDFIKNLENPKVNALRVIEPYPTPYPTIITSPANNTSFSAGLPIEFRATGEGSANWISDLDGSIGTGNSLDVSGLSVGSHTITLEMSTFNSVIRAVSIDLDIIDPYLEWRDQQIWNGKDDSKAGDPDSDAISNQLERAFGLNPLLADLAGLPYPSIEEIESVRYFTFTYRRNLDASDLDYWIESSTTLEPLSWSAEALNSENNETIEEDGRTQIMRFKRPVDNDTRFFRLRIE